jgi:protein-disulfide isomerase
MSRLTQPVGPSDHTLGPLDAPVQLVEYLDYECPFCARAHHVVAEVLDRVGDEVLYVPRHFPLTQIHPHALLAAQAAEAAGAQGRFWPMHATLFENQHALDFDSILVYADALGLDVSRFTRELRTGAHLPKVQNDFKSGVRSGVNGTPTFFVNGDRLNAGWDAFTLMAAIRQAALGQHPIGARDQVRMHR